MLVHGFLNLHKPLAMTSHDCVGMVRRLLGIRKVGHGGTLDPLAQGVLPLAIGRATRLLPYLAPGKTYTAVIRFGLTTTSDDLEGDILSQSSASWLTLNQIEAILPQFEGTIQQVPPAYSAIQVDGKRLYDLARRGKAVTVPSRTVTIHHLEVKGWQPGEYPELTLAVQCGAGTYIRSLARDLGVAVGAGATLAGLIRTGSSGFRLEHSLTLEQVQAQVEAQTLALVAPEAVLSHLEAIALPPDLAHRWRQGQKFPPPMPMPPDIPYRVLAADGGTFLGIGQWENREEGPILKAKVVLQPAG
ncbi:tRNA pseudouridine(55) synthase TruB [Nodosilinea sp. P-1105]|uniref:tRNA pseudouridine(55) synthase TruB n=1 Tax=Nodosilinea sp. P-1105 TaxID=2546229 RepID=UPI00146D3246|nr:tRNA pseudouridine(55) synthase TruB [Nodosilinea sp. P-1105]NMF85562.1 tRNA pseudouridine(55) synthase TruB [Nodosilinea sp. P-1105]